MFREDLFFRLSVVNLNIPPLRKTPKTLIALCKKFLNEKSNVVGDKLNKPAIKEDVKKLFLKYQWPGNIRELSNVIEASLSMSDTGNISIQHLPKRLQDKGEDPYLYSISKNSSLSEYLRNVEKKLIAAYSG